MISLWRNSSWRQGARALENCDEEPFGDSEQKKRAGGASCASVLIDFQTAPKVRPTNPNQTLLARKGDFNAYSIYDGGVLSSIDVCSVDLSESRRRRSLKVPLLTLSELKLAGRKTSDPLPLRCFECYHYRPELFAAAPLCRLRYEYQCLSYWVDFTIEW